MYKVYGKIGDEAEFTCLEEFNRYSDAEWYIENFTEQDPTEEPITEFKIHDTAGTLQASWV